jgi:tetratricopeptide (TPR) repeat protein
MLANFSLQNQVQLKEIALPAARQAILLNPQDAQSLDVMGKVYLALGDDVTASRFIHRALHNDPQYAPAYLHLGMIYLNQGEAFRARQQFELAEQMADQEAVVDQAQRMIEYYFP